MQAKNQQKHLHFLLFHHRNHVI